MSNIACTCGHRPKKLGVQNPYSPAATVALEAIARKLITDHGITHVISGGALGWDQACARAARELGLPYVMALPFRGFDSRWPQSSRDDLAELIQGAAGHTYVSDREATGFHFARAMQARNEWMIDRAHCILALWNGERGGGTWNALQYAGDGWPVHNGWDLWVRHRRTIW